MVTRNDESTVVVLRPEDAAAAAAAAVIRSSSCSSSSSDGFCEAPPRRRGHLDDSAPSSPGSSSLDSTVASTPVRALAGAGDGAHALPNQMATASFSPSFIGTQKILVSSQQVAALRSPPESALYSSLETVSLSAPGTASPAPRRTASLTPPITALPCQRTTALCGEESRTKAAVDKTPPTSSHVVRAGIATSAARGASNEHGVAPRTSVDPDGAGSADDSSEAEAHMPLSEGERILSLTLRTIFCVIPPGRNERKVATPARMMMMAYFACRMAFLSGTVDAGDVIYDTIMAMFQATVPGWNRLCRMFQLRSRGLFLFGRLKKDSQFRGQPSSAPVGFNHLINPEGKPQWVSRRLCLRQSLYLFPSTQAPQPGDLTAEELVGLRNCLSTTQFRSACTCMGVSIVPGSDTNGKRVDMASLEFNFYACMGHIIHSRSSSRLPEDGFTEAAEPGPLVHVSVPTRLC